MLGVEIAGGGPDQQVARVLDEGRPHQHGRPVQIQLRLPGTGDCRRRPQRMMQSLVNTRTMTRNQIEDGSSGNNHAVQTTNCVDRA